MYEILSSWVSWVILGIVVTLAVVSFRAGELTCPNCRGKGTVPSGRSYPSTGVSDPNLTVDPGTPCPYCGAYPEPGGSGGASDDFTRAYMYIYACGCCDDQKCPTCNGTGRRNA